MPGESGAGPFLRGRRLRLTLAVAVVLTVTAMSAGGARLLRGWSGDDLASALVRRGRLAVTLLESGVIRPARSITYGSPIPGREVEVAFLAPEGTHVNAGDLVVKLEASDVERELERTAQAEREARSEIDVAVAELEDAAGALQSLVEGEGALEVEEARAALARVEWRAARLRAERAGLEPLLEKGFITREELERAASELAQAESEVALTRRRVQYLAEQGHPRARQRAKLQVSQREARVQNAQHKLAETARMRQMFEAAVKACRIYAEQPGLVVYEENLAANPRRKVRVGDRVTSTQGLLTIPEVSHMLVEASVREADVHLVKIGQTVSVRVDAYPAVRLSGRVTGLGALAESASDRPGDDKRFDLVVTLAPGTTDLRPEMTARVEILVDERRDVLLVPVTALFDRTGSAVAYVKHRWSVETRRVEVGATNAFEAEIRSGLAVGERVLLVDPDSAGGTAPADDTTGPTSGRPGRS